MFSYRSTNHPDAYMRPVFPVSNKIRRAAWNLSWLLLCRWTPRPMHRWRVFILRLFGAKIGATCFVYPNCSIWAPWLLSTEEKVTIGPGVEIYNPGGAHLGHHCVLSQNSFLCGATHNCHTPLFAYIKKEISIGAYAWICSRAILLPGVKCGEGSVLGAGSVGSSDLAAWTIYAGNPARAIKQRNNFLINSSASTFSKKLQQAL